MKKFLIILATVVVLGGVWYGVSNLGDKGDGQGSINTDISATSGSSNGLSTGDTASKSDQETQALIRGEVIKAYLEPLLRKSIVDIKIVKIQKAVWPDVCYGFPGLLGQDCTSGDIPGWKVDVLADGIKYEVRFNESGTVPKVHPNVYQ